MPGGPRGGLEDPFFNRRVLESLIYPFWLHFGSILASILGSFWALFSYFFGSDVLMISGGFWSPFWAPFWLRLGVILQSKIHEKSCWNFDAVPRWIWGAPGPLRARKLWFSLRKTKVFKDPPFRAQAPPRSILELKTEPKWSQNGLQNP